MKESKIEKDWNEAWTKHIENVRAFRSKLMVAKTALSKVCVQDYCRNYVETNMNTHRVIYLSQELNGTIEASTLISYLVSEETIKVTGNLSTSDGKTGIAEAKVTCGSHSYEIAFTDLPFYTEYVEKLSETGGILNGDMQISTDISFKSNVLCSGKITIEKDASLTAENGVTIVANCIENYGIFKGTITGNISIHDGALFNGTLYLGCIDTEGYATITGFFVGDTLSAADNTTVYFKHAGGMFNAMDFGKKVTLVLADSEPGLCSFDGLDWYADFDHSLEDVMRKDWFILGDKTPTDMMGREWTVPFDKNALIRPDVSIGGVINMEPDLAVRGEKGTNHNYGMLTIGKESITDVEGAVYIFTSLGLGYPKMDGENLVISDVYGDGTSESPYEITYKEKNENHTYSSPIDLSLQALVTPVISKRFEDTTWRFWSQENEYKWYGYNNFKDCEHWHGENGNETVVIYMKKENV